MSLKNNNVINIALIGEKDGLSNMSLSYILELFSPLST